MFFEARLVGKFCLFLPNNFFISLSQVNGKDVRKATHQEAVMALIAPTFEIVLEVRHDPPPPGLQELTVYKAPGEKLGVSIKGGARGIPGNPLDSTDEGIFISKVSHEF